MIRSERDGVIGRRYDRCFRFNTPKLHNLARHYCRPSCWSRFEWRTRRDQISEAPPGPTTRSSSRPTTPPSVRLVAITSVRPPTSFSSSFFRSSAGWCGGGKPWSVRGKVPSVGRLRGRSARGDDIWGAYKTHQGPSVEHQASVFQHLYIRPIPSAILPKGHLAYDRQASRRHQSHRHAPVGTAF